MSRCLIVKLKPGLLFYFIYNLLYIFFINHHQKGEGVRKETQVLLVVDIRFAVIYCLMINVTEEYLTV